MTFVSCALSRHLYIHTLTGADFLSHANGHALSKYIVDSFVANNTYSPADNVHLY